MIKPGTNYTGLFSAEDWLPTLVAAAGGDQDLPAKVRGGVKAGDKTFKVHLDGYNQLNYLKGTAPTSRDEFIYFDDDGNLVAYRNKRFKAVFDAQYNIGMAVWRQPMTKLRAPLFIDLLSDPYENSVDGAANWEQWAMDHAFLILPMVERVGEYLATYKDFPPRQRPASFSIDQVIEKLNSSIGTR